MDRATSPVVGVALLVALTVMAGAAVGTAAIALEPPAEQPIASFSLTVDADTGSLTLHHRGGDTVDVATLDLLVSVEDQLLETQPPVPFFAAEGFRSGPTGPFNRGADPSWTAGERGTIRLASTNAPLPGTGDRVSVRLLHGNYSIGTVQAVAT